MINTISNIPAGIRSGLERIPKSQNRVVNTVRALVLFAVVMPGSCASISAAGSLIYKTINGSSVSEADSRSSGQKSGKDQVLSPEEKADPLSYESVWSCDEK
jgi:hypothetical protein